MTRRQLRESIFQILFRIAFVSREECMEQLEQQEVEQLELNQEEEDMLPEATIQEQAQIRAKLSEIFANLDTIDQMIEDASEGWHLSRLGKAELAILRLSVYEMKFDDTVPEKVAINEAVELAKAYCPEEASGFINAVLGKLSSSRMQEWAEMEETCGHAEADLFSRTN